MARPKGSENKDKPFREALRLEIADAGKDLKALRKVAKALLDKAGDGDVQAIKEVADRLDGKATQHIEQETTHRYVARVPEKTPTTEKWQQSHAPQPTQH